MFGAFYFGQPRFGDIPVTGAAPTLGVIGQGARLFKKRREDEEEENDDNEVLRIVQEAMFRIDP